ncbi:ATP-binding cassette domain-containing protein [Acetobacteraceae bacterium]|nr:ATP-binding cassette domain-containing protein [Acetobacteraceae bacterium]
MNLQRLSLKNLTITTQSKDKKREIISNLSLELQQGKILALLGASGSGKTMACAGILDTLPTGIRATYDSLLLNGTRIQPAQLRGEKIASIMQNPRSAFNPLKNMYAHAKETLKALGKNTQNDRQKILKAMQDSGLENIEELLSLYAFEMSGGQLQRMMISLALLSEAPFLIADEPTSDLDLIVQHQVLTLIEKLVKERNLGVLLITHDLSVVAKLANEVAVMDQGRIIEQASVQNIFSKPQHPVTQNLLQAHFSLYEGMAELP